MLSELTIKNLGVIAEATLALGPGLTVVTGETGAGKTMVVSGLGLVAGARADAHIVRRGQAAAVVEARFTAVSPPCAAAVDATGGQIEDDELLVTRQVGASGRSRSWIGGVSVTQAVARSLGEDLVTIHGQSEQIRLSTPQRQREVLDRAAGEAMADRLAAYHMNFERHRHLSAELAQLTQSARERARELDMLNFGLAEIAKVDPLEDEDELLAQEARRLQDADELRACAYQGLTALVGEDDDMDQTSALTLLAVARKELEQLAARDEATVGLHDRAREISALTADLAGELSSYVADVVADPVRLEWIEERLSQLKGLTRKYGSDINQVRQWAEDAAARVAEVGDVADRSESLQAEIAALDAALADQAAGLTAARRMAAADFGKRVGDELAALAMPHATVQFEVSPLAQRGPWGADSVALLFTANPGAEPAPLGKIASGGELSRVRLAIEVVLADDQFTQTYVFDEVDAGIGGAVGLQVGLRLARLATHGQVIVVTHLAQVAAFAATQYVVAKTSDGDVTSSGLTEVRDEDRAAELARMMGGLVQSDSALSHAHDLLHQAAAMMDGAGAVT